MQLTLVQGYGLATMLVVAGVAIALAAAFYRRAFGALGFRRWRVLFVLRAAAILLVVMLLFQPVLSYQNVSTQRPGLVFLLDTSASMGIADDDAGTTRFEQARAKLEKWRAQVQSAFRVRTVAFSEQAAPLLRPEELSGLTATGQGTSLVAAIEAAAKQFPPAELAAVVLISDGIHNAAGDPVQSARNSGMLIHTVGVGASLRSNPSFRDVQVAGIDCPDRMMLGNLARVGGSIEAIGLGGHVIPVCLDEDGRQIAQTELTLDPAGGRQQVAFDFRPLKKGRHSYTVRVPPVAGERIVENNQRSAMASVDQADIHVLYVEGTLRAEYGALVNRFLAKDPDLGFCALVQTRPNVFLRRTNMPELQLAAIPADRAAFDKFEVFILGDLDSIFLRPAQQEMLLSRVRAGAGLLMLGGYHSLGPGGYAGTPLGRALPVELGDRAIGQFTEPLLPVLTAEGRRHPIFANISRFFPTQQGPAQSPGLPPLDGCTRLGRARPQASVLATLSAEAAAMPVLAVAPCDRGRTAVFAADTTRNWQQGPEAFDRESPFVRFWGQLVRWLAGRSETLEAKASVAVTTDKSAYEAGEPVHLSAVVRDKDGEGAAGATAIAQVTASQGGPWQVMLTPVSGPSGHYAGVFEPHANGRYQAGVDARIGDLNLKSENVVFEVGRLHIEFERLDLDDKMLAAIAVAAGGRYAHISTADHLISQLDRSQRKKLVAVQQPLCWPPGFWVLFVIVLTAEWSLRRRYHLR